MIQRWQRNNPDDLLFEGKKDILIRRNRNHTRRFLGKTIVGKTILAEMQTSTDVLHGLANNSLAISLVQNRVLENVLLDCVE